jgi:hypothetical protein
MQYVLYVWHGFNHKLILSILECSQKLPHWFENNDDLVCGFYDSCTYIKCCLNSKPLGRSFTINVEIMTCEFKMVIAIEKVKQEISLINYNWGTSETVSLFGIVTLT